MPKSRLDPKSQPGAWRPLRPRGPCSSPLFLFWKLPSSWTGAVLTGDPIWHATLRALNVRRRRLIQRR